MDLNDLLYIDNNNEIAEFQNDFNHFIWSKHYSNEKILYKNFKNLNDNDNENNFYHLIMNFIKKYLNENFKLNIEYDFNSFIFKNNIFIIYNNEIYNLNDLKIQFLEKELKFYFNENKEDFNLNKLFEILNYNFDFNENNFYKKVKFSNKEPALRAVRLISTLINNFELVKC